MCEKCNRSNPQHPDWVNVTLPILRAMWRELYRAKSLDLTEFVERIPCPRCKRHWLDLVGRNPPPEVGSARWKCWVVDRHNDVNRVLGKREFSYHQAEMANFVVVRRIN